MEIGWDIETTMHHDFYWRRIRTIQFGTQTEQFVIDLLSFVRDADELTQAQGNYGKMLDFYPVLQEVINLIAPFLQSRNHLKIGVNLGFEYLMMYWCFGLRTQNFFDCMIVEKVIQAGAHGLKDYPFYSMESLMGRYFGVEIDKTYQTSFTIDQPLIQEQINYAALDTRLPFGLKKLQSLILQGHTAETCKLLKDVDPILLGDNLERVAQLENDAIGSFQDMHLHGERLDKDKWNERVSRRKEELRVLIKDRLDPIFVPLVGSKSEQVTQEEVDQLHANWKALTVPGPAEVAMKGEIAKIRRSHPAMAAGMRETLATWEAERKEEKNRLKEIWNERSKHLTAIRSLSDECEGDALINYASGAQMLRCINENFQDIREYLGKVYENRKWTGKYKKLESLEDETLNELSDFPVMVYIKEYHKLSKEINTYGDAWTMQWTGQDRPSAEYGWLHPGDGRLHCMFNQYDAETGRSSSSQPNGQNIPKDKALRACFIADPGEVLVTADMSGAELRILAELSGDPVWIGAFERGEDVHSICADLMDPEEWLSLAEADCAYFKDNARKKCKCPKHNEKRDEMKPTNFGLPYGIGPGALSIQIGKTRAQTKLLMRKHEETFPVIWEYLEESGSKARAYGRAFDMFGRRRIFLKPSWERARLNAMEYKKDTLKYPEEVQARNLTSFIASYGRKPTPQEKWLLNHRVPTDEEIKESIQAMHMSIERQGKNHEIQGTNASIAKRAMAILWHELPKYKARLVKFVHDELVVASPEEHGQTIADLIGKAFLEAGKEVMHRVEMTFEFNIGPHWAK